MSRTPATFVRWCRFNLVGILGVGVQLAALAALNRLAPGHYLLATAAAIEVAVLHNFVWHTRYTWADRTGPLLPPLLRFHLSNGLVSLAGNLALMRLLVRHAHVPALAANAVAIACCSVLNFLLAHLWAFPAPRKVLTRTI